MKLVSVVFDSIILSPSPATIIAYSCHLMFDLLSTNRVYSSNITVCDSNIDIVAIAIAAIILELALVVNS